MPGDKVITFNVTDVPLNFNYAIWPPNDTTPMYVILFSHAGTGIPITSTPFLTQVALDEAIASFVEFHVPKKPKGAE